ncbi:uncharacterized protein [Montipora capricornis]|uniref:uncharacterized protein n=1 Tax=Montipora capricornis TaxID=246305 RepID=UPI0035F17C80
MRSWLFVLLATGAFAAPLSWNTERSPQCDKKLDRFHYLKEFPYNYEGETISRVAGASSARSGLKIRARCVVKPVAPCQHVLKLDTVELWEAQSKNPGPLRYRLSQGTTAFAEELEARELVFRTDRGLITELLADPREPLNALNVKRGILSALQVQFVDRNVTLVEDDVVGKCKVRYGIKSRHLSGRPKVMYKTRNLTECSDRAQTDIGIHVHSYEEKPLSLLSSHSTCKLYLTAKTRTQKVICEEQHLFRPFSAGYKNASGAMTTTRQVLELQSIKESESESISIEGLRPVSLKFGHEQPQSNEDGIRDAFYLVTRLSKDSHKNTKPDSAQHFSELVFSIRKLSTEAMEKLWQKVHQEEDPKMLEYFYDALPHCGTGGCAKVMSDAIRSKLVSHERGNMFLAGLAMAANPTKETIAHVLGLCTEHNGRTAMLTLGTLIHKVCESSPIQCEKKTPEDPISRAESFLLSQLGKRCEGSTSEEFENILMTLKAIGNAGRPESAEDILLKCALNQDAPVNMSIAALEALRRLPCDRFITDQLLNIYGNHDLDVEIRIAAYLALMRCPSAHVFKGVANVLKDEVNNQVGSFVWSHMTNAMESTEPVQGLPQARIMKDALNGMKLREFNLNRLRFSRAWEGSFYHEGLRFGGSAQSHLIFHPTSFVPRSAMLNLTVDVLGASINVLETAARFEGVEILIEQFFGDEGYFPDERIMKMFNLQPHEERDNVERTVNRRLRRRSLGIHEDINRVQNNLNQIHRAMDNRKHHPSGSISMKMFGNELRLASFDDIGWLNDEIDKVNVIDFLLMMAKGGEKTFSKSLMFLDAQTVVPTILGLPLKLSAKGTTVASVELAGKFDIRNMFWGKMSFDIRGHIKPSAVVDISGRMGVSAFHAESGILVNSTLYTVTQTKGNATYSQGELLKFEIGVPEDPVQFVNVSSSLFTTLNDEKLAVEGTPRRIEPSPCLNVTRLLGLKFCSQLSLPLAYRGLESPFFPLSGPASYSISMQRTDPKLTRYQLLVERLQTEDENKYDVIASMSTPGATWERKFDANVTLWIKEDGKLFTLSGGVPGVEFGKLEARYNNVSHAVNLTYTTAKDVIFGHPVILNGQFFNSTKDSLSRDLGIHLSASYGNYTIRQLTKLYYKPEGVFGYVNNITYWTGKYVFATGELNIPMRSISFVTNHTCSKTELTFNGNLGDEDNKFMFTFNNGLANVGMDLTGRHLKSQKEGVLRLFTRPLQQSFTLRGHYAERGDERGIRFIASHDNMNRVLRWYSGIVQSPNEKALKTNATVFGSKAEAVLSYFNLGQKKGIKFRGLLLDKTINAVGSFVDVGVEKGLSFNASGFDTTAEAAFIFLNLPTEKSMKFNASVINKTIAAIWSYVNSGNEKGLKMNAVAMNYSAQSSLVLQDFSDTRSIKLNATTLNKTVEAVWSYVNREKEKGLRLNVAAFNRTAVVMGSYFTQGKQSGIHLNASALNRTMDATWTLINQASEKALKLHGRAFNKNIHATWSILHSSVEKGMKFNASVLNKTFDAKWTFVNLANEKALNFHGKTQNLNIYSSGSLLLSDSEKSLKFNISALEKSFEAKCSYLNFTSEKGFKFQARALNKTMDATWSFLNMAGEKTLKFNASALNKTLDAKWSLINLAHGKSLKFNAQALNKTIKAAWSFLNVGKKKTLLFKASAMNNTVDASWVVVNLERKKSLIFKANVFEKPVEIAWTILNHTREKGLKFSAKAQNSAVDAAWTFASLSSEKTLIFRVNALNKRMESFWSYVNLPNERGIKFNVTGLDKPFGAALTLTSLTNEKRLKFNSTGLGKHAEAIWSYMKTTNEHVVKFNASAMKKSVEVSARYLRSDNERAIKLTASVMNKTMESVWSYVTNEKENSLKFNASAETNSVQAVLSYLVSENEKSIAFSASAMNKSVQATWSYVKNENEKSLHFKAACANRSAEAFMSYLRNKNDRALKFKFSSMNKTVEATWTYVKKENERSLRFEASALKKTVEAVWSFIEREDGASLKFKASAMGKFAEAVLAFTENESGRSLKLSAFAMNKTVETSWSYLNTENGRSIKFKASAVNKTLEASWTLLSGSSKKGLQFNLAVMNKSMNSSLVYFNEPTSSGLRFDVNSCNKSLKLESKLIFQEKQRTLVTSATYQNYTMALIGQLQQLKSQKSACIYPEYFGRSHGKICAVFTNSSIERSLSLNMEVLNKTVELKTRMFNRPDESAHSFTAKFNKNILLESWFSFSNLEEMKTLHFNTTVSRKSIGASLYFRNTTEKAVGLKASVMNKYIAVEGIWLNGKTLKEAAVLLYCNETVVSKLSLTLLTNDKRKMVQLRSQIGRFVAEWQTTLINPSEGVKDLFVVRMLRNGSRNLFFDSSKLTLLKEDRGHSLGYQYNLKLMGRSYEYGWVAVYNNYSNTKESYHKTRLSFIYSKGNTVSLTGVFRNNSGQLLSDLTVEYLPDKTLRYSLTWFKQDNSLEVNMEVLPRKPITWTLSWITENGISIESDVKFLDKKISNWFTYIQSTGEYYGHFEICPAYPVEVKGLFVRENGLFLTSQIGALNRTWNHRIDFRQEEQTLLVSVDIIPNTPVTLDASWDTSEGMKIGVDMKAFRRSLSLSSSYNRLTKTLQSGITLFKKTFAITNSLDVDTKTLSVMLEAFNRTIGLTGRFDWKNFVASTFMSYQNNQAGWFIRYNPASRSIIFNVTMTPTISGQIVGDIPDDDRVQLTLQRIVGSNIVNEARGIYHLNAEGSRFSLTWNMTSLNMLIGNAENLKSLVANVFMTYYNLTLQRGENLTTELEAVFKKLDAQIRPHVLNLYAQINKYDYQGLLQKTSKMAHNITVQLSVFMLKAASDTVENLPYVLRNATVLYKEILGIVSVLDKRILRNLTDLYKRFQSEVYPLIADIVTLHLKNISKDLETWSKNVSIMLNGVKVQGKKIGDIIRNLSRKLKEITTEFVRKVDLKTRERIVKIREIQIRGQKIGPLFDNVMLNVQEFTCGFNASCTTKNLLVFAKKLQKMVGNITVLNKTIQMHFNELNETVHLQFTSLNATVRQQLLELHDIAYFIHQQAVNFTRNIVTITPSLLENVTSQAIYLTRNISKEARAIAIKIKIVVLETYAKLMKVHGPLINLTTKAFILPITKFAVKLNNNVTRYLQSMAAPFAPVLLDVISQLRNVYIRNVSVGVAIDRAVAISHDFTWQAYRYSNKTLTTIIIFVRETSQKSPQQIIDISFTKGIYFFNLTKEALNNPVWFNLSDHASALLKRSIATLNSSLQELLRLQPKDILDIFIGKVQVISRNVTEEIFHVTTQLRALDLVSPVKSAWAKMDLMGKINALKLQWENLIQHLKDFSIMEKALLLRYHISNATLKIQKEVQKFFTLSQRVLNLTENLMRMATSKDALLEEFISIGNEIGRILMKYGVLAKNTALEVERRLKKISLEHGALYKNTAINKTIEAYNVFRKHGQALYDEHREEALAVYNSYKDLAQTMYNTLTEIATKKFHVYREKLIAQAKAFVAELSKYENMSYEEIVVKIYEYLNKHGLTLYKNITLTAEKLYQDAANRAGILFKNMTIQGLDVYKNVSLRGLEVYKNITLRAIDIYKNLSALTINIYKNIASRGVHLYENVTLRAMEFFNDAKTVTLRAHNLTLVLINRAKLLAFKYLNVTAALSYYNVTREFTLEFYEFTRDLAGKYYHKYYKIGRNYTLHIYNMTRNMTLSGFYKIRGLFPPGTHLMGYFNDAILPKIEKSLLNGKIMVLKYMNETVLMLTESLYIAKAWYHENKEKTLEKLIQEAYELAERKSIEAQKVLQLRFNELKEPVRQKIKELGSKYVKIEEWTNKLQQLNKTLFEITKEAVSLYNQTANITYIAAEELIAILDPYFKVVQNKTLFFLVNAKTVSLPLIDKAKMFIFVKGVKTVEMVRRIYLEFMSRKDIQEFIGKRHWQERLATAERFVREKYIEALGYVKEIRPKVEAEIQTAIDYINATLPAQLMERFALIKGRYHMLQLKYRRIVANPKVFMENVLRMALMYLRNVTRETPAEKYLYQETWLGLIEEVKGHQLVEYSKILANYTQGDMQQAAQLVSNNVRSLVLSSKHRFGSLKESLRARIQETRETLLERLGDVKGMKLREISEHNYVLKAIELAINVTTKMQDMTLHARNLTREIVAFGKFYFKNINEEVRNYTLLLRTKFNDATMLLRQTIQNYVINLKRELHSYSELLNEAVKNYATILKTEVQSYINFFNASVQNYTRSLNASLQNYTIIANASIQEYRKIFSAKVHKYTKMMKAQFENFTLILKGHYGIIYNTHVLPLYRNGSILIHKYKAFAGQCVGKCRNVTLRAVELARSWAMDRVHETQVWINQTVDSGMKYYNSELKPLYYETLLPFYNSTLVPLYYNWNLSKLLLDLKENVTIEAITLRERALNLTRQVTTMAVNCPHFNMLRKLGKVTVRESFVEGRKIFMQAINLPRIIVNATLTKFNVTKACLQRAINKTMLALDASLLEAEPVIAFLNATRVELMETAIFLSKYSGLEDAVKERVRRSIHIIKNTTLHFVSYQAPEFLKASAMKAHELIKRNMQLAEAYVNQTMVNLEATLSSAKYRLNLAVHNLHPSMNKTIDRIMKGAHAAYNKAIGIIRDARVPIKAINIIDNAREAFITATNEARAYIDGLPYLVEMNVEAMRLSLAELGIRIDKAIVDVRAALPKYIQVSEGAITFVIPHSSSFDKNITTIVIALVEKVKSLPQLASNKMVAIKQMLMQKFRTLKRDSLEKIKSLEIKMMVFKAQTLDNVNYLREKALMKIGTLKDEMAIQIRSLRSEALIKVETLKRRIIEKFGDLKVELRNLNTRVKALGRAWVAAAADSAVFYRQKAYGFVMEAYNFTKNHPITSRYIDVTLNYINITKELAVLYSKNGYAFVLNAYNLTKNHPLVREFFSTTAHRFNNAKEMIIQYNNKALMLARKYYILAKNHPEFVKYSNMTVRYFIITKNFVTGLDVAQVKNKTMAFLDRGFSLCRRYLNSTNFKSIAQRYFVQAVNITRGHEIFNYAKNITNKLINVSHEWKVMIKNGTAEFLALSRRCPFLQQPKNVTMKYLHRAVILTRHCLNITQHHLLEGITLLRHSYHTGVNITLMYSNKVYKNVELIAFDILNSTCLEDAFGKVQNYSKNVFDVTMELCGGFSQTAVNKSRALFNNFATMASNRTLYVYKNLLGKARNFSNPAVRKTIKLFKHLYKRSITIVLNTTLVKRYLPIVHAYVSTALDSSRNFGVQCYRVVSDVSRDIYNSSNLTEVFGKAKNHSMTALGAFNKGSQEAIAQANIFTRSALNQSVVWYNDVREMALEKALTLKRKALFEYRKFYSRALNKTVESCGRLYRRTLMIVYNTTFAKKCYPLAKRAIEFCRRLYDETKMTVHNTRFAQKYLPMAKRYIPIVLNAARNFTVQTYKTAVHATTDIYNSRSLMEAYNKTSDYFTIALNSTLSKTRYYSDAALNKARQLYREAAIKTKNYSADVVKKTLRFCQRIYNETAPILYNSVVVKKYLPMAVSFSRRCWNEGYGTIHNFTVGMYNYFFKVSLDIRDSNSLTQVMIKLRNYCANAFHRSVQFCRDLYYQLFDATVRSYNALSNQSVALYQKIANHEMTTRCINKTRNYFGQTKNMVKTQVKNIHRVKGHMQKRIGHKVDQMSSILNPLNWIPPFNSTAIIFGSSHVYTFDGTYYTFPGYKKSDCMYVLARDVRDDKFTILSQETAIIVVTEDSTVKIHQDGRVETIVKITSSGQKISDGYLTELPVQTLKTSVLREGSFIVLRHNLGLEIVCDVEHYLCTFNIAKWYHGRMAGLLGTNNNERHDEFMTIYNNLTKNFTTFVNSWEATRDPECIVHPTDIGNTPKCKPSSNIKRCRALFKEENSPLSRYFSIVDPKPFLKACELDYHECDTDVPKDMRHCNTTAAYIELVRMRGEWADYLPECGRCGSKYIGQRWFQQANRKVDVVVLVQETSMLQRYAEQLPIYLNNVVQDLDPSKYSFKFGVMAYGGRLSHEHPHAITLDGQLMNDLPSVERAFEHLKFAGVESQNDSSDALEAIAKAAYIYPFRPAATKLFLLLTGAESGVYDQISVDNTGKLLETKDITLNVIGKYRKLRGEIVGQDYRGKVFYRKKPEVGTGLAALPDGDHMKLMKETQGSVFGLSFLGSHNKDKFGALQQASVSTWREQIKRDQFVCKECFCARGDVGQGKTICKVNSFHQKC